MKICAHCKAPLRFDPDRGGWLHPGGGLYVQRCGECGHVSDGPSIHFCPKCYSKRLWRDDHCALPIEPEPATT